MLNHHNLAHFTCNSLLQYGLICCSVFYHVWCIISSYSTGRDMTANLFVKVSWYSQTPFLYGNFSIKYSQKTQYIAHMWGIEFPLWVYIVIYILHLSLPYCIDGLVQERRNSSALAMELRLSCTNSSICNNVVWKIMLKGGSATVHATMINPHISCLFVERVCHLH